MSAVLQANRSDEMRVIVTTDSAQIKIEVSPVARGTLYPPQEREVVGEVEDVLAMPAFQWFRCLTSTVENYARRWIASIPEIFMT